jgi:hypothetical protein
MIMTIDRSIEILDLHKEGLDPFTIARKLELTVPEVENVILGQAKDGPGYDAWTVECMHWGAHY